jgi:hypothetical protein
MEEIDLEYLELCEQMEEPRRQLQRQTEEYQDRRSHLLDGQHRRKAVIQECQQPQHLRNLVNNAFDYEEIVEETGEELLEYYK